jgi:hypothetical protein
MSGQKLKPVGVQPPPVPSLQGKSFYHQAATASVLLLLFPFLIQFASATAMGGLPPEDRGNVEFFVAVLIGLSTLTGIVLGIIALFGIPQYGTKGILVKALCGILVPILLALLAIPVILHARELARMQAAEQQQQSP